MLENILQILKIKENKKIIVELNQLLTEKNYKLVNIKPNENVTEEELLETAAYAESNSSHNIAKVIVSIYGKVNKNFACEVEEEEGKGISAKYNFEKVYAGNRKHLFDKNIEFTQVITENIPIYIAKEDKYLGYILLKIELDSSVYEKVKAIKENKLDIILISGEKKDIVEKIAEDLGVTEFYYSLDKKEKEEKIKELTEKYNAVLYKKEKEVM